MKLIAPLRSLVLSPLFFYAAAGLAQAQPTYTLTELGYFQPTALNNGGLVVGLDSSNPSGGVLEYRYGSEFNARYFAGASGVNDAGIIVGYVLTSGVQPLLISPSGVQTVINPFDLMNPMAGATAVNASGLVTGYAYTQEGGYEHGFTYDIDSGTLTDLGTLGGDYSVANAVNASGWVTGQARTGDGHDHAYGFYGTGSLVDLGTLPGGFYSDGLAISSAGLVTGYAQAANGNEHAFLCCVNDGPMQDLGTMDGRHSHGTGINDSGQIVGYVDYPPNGTHRAFFYDINVGVMVDLNSMVKPGPLAASVTLSDAVAINDKGWILAYGFNAAEGRVDAFLVTPKPVLPTTPSNLAATAGNGSVSLGWTPSRDAGGAPIQYTVYQGTSPGAEYTPVWSGMTASVTLPGLGNGTTYYFVVEAASVGGITGKSNEASATPQSTLPIVNLQARPATIYLGSASTLAWSAQYASTCTASGAWSGRVALHGTRSVAPTARGTYTYTLTCTGAGGSLSGSATLRVR